MLRNYLTVAIRALAKNRAYALINILGLAIGMGACLTILLYVFYENSYDRWIPGVKNSYQLQAWYDGFDTGSPFYLQMSSYSSGEALAKDFPQVEKKVYAMSTRPVFYKDGQASTTDEYVFADGNLLDVIQLPLVRGNPHGLEPVDTIMLTQSEATTS